MKPLVAGKSVVSLLGVEREEDATALFSYVLGNLVGERRQIDDCEKTLTGINVCPLVNQLQNL
jgi:hypothetical protein